MKHKYEVTDSSTIKCLEYDFEKARLLVEFKAGAKYTYSAVPEDVAREFFLAESKGKHFAANIKDKYITEKIGAVLNTPSAVSWTIGPRAVPAKKATPVAPAKAFKAPLARPEGSWPFPVGYKS